MLVVNQPHRQLLSVLLVVNQPHRQLLSVLLVVNQPHRQLLSVLLVFNQPHRQLIWVLAKASTGGRPSTAKSDTQAQHSRVVGPCNGKVGERGGGVDETSLRTQSHFIFVCV